MVCAAQNRLTINPFGKQIYTNLLKLALSIMTGKQKATTIL
jgi:uncharacterized protein (DUF2235 family)